MAVHRLGLAVVLVAAGIFGVTVYLSAPALVRPGSNQAVELSQILSHIHRVVASNTSAELKPSSRSQDSNIREQVEDPLILHDGTKTGEIAAPTSTAYKSYSTKIPLTEEEKYGIPWVQLPISITEPPEASSVKSEDLLNVEEFMNDKTLKAVDDLFEVPDEWKAVADIKTKLQVPYWIVRDNTSKEVVETEKEWAAALANGKGDGLSIFAQRTVVNPKLTELAKAGAWKRGKVETIDANEWPFAPDLFTHAYVLQIPWGFLGDNHIFGTAAPAGKRLHFGMGRYWMTNRLGHIKGCYSPNNRPGRGQWAKVQDLGEIALSAESWQGDHFQHFVLDTLPRISLLYNQLINVKNESLLSRAKIIFNRGPAPAWFMNKLGIASERLVDGIGWCIKSDHLFRARLALYPEYHNIPTASDPRPDARHGVHPRGALAPIQRALGVWDDTRRDTVVYIQRKGGRSLRRDIESAIIEGMKARLAKAGHGLQVQPLVYTGKQEDSLALMRRAIMVFGVHGGGLANAVFCKPGTAFVEIMPIRIMHLLKHRTSKYCYYGLAQAAGLDYYTVEPPFFDWGRPGIDPDPRDLLDILEHVLVKHGHS